MTMPLPPVPKPLGSEEDFEEEGTEFTDNEITFILNSTLKERQRNNPLVLKFIHEFLRCQNVAEASAACGIKATVGFKIRRRRDVSSAITAIMDKSILKDGFDGAEIVARVKEVVDFDPIEVMNPDGTFKSNMHDIDPSSRRCLKKLKVKNCWEMVEDHNGIKSKIITGEVIEYEFYDKLKAADMVGSDKNRFTKTTKIEHDVSKDMKNILLESKTRAMKAVEVINVESRRIEE